MDTLTGSTATLLERLATAAPLRTREAVRGKRDLLDALARRTIGSARPLARLHALACYLVAFPDDRAVRDAAVAVLDGFAARVAALSDRAWAALDDSGIAGTRVRYEFSLESVEWLSARYPGDAAIDWERYEAPERIDPLLQALLAPAEQDAYHDGAIGWREWLDLERGAAPGTDLDWLLRELRASVPEAPARAALYERAETPVAWRLRDARGSITRNRIATPRLAFRSSLRAGPADPRRAVARPLTTVEQLDPDRAHVVLDVVRAALLARRREVYAMQHANPEEVWLAHLGRGATIALLGVPLARRLSLESNYGYVMFENGMPVGYGGVTPLFTQGNTGVNVFAEYRHGESAFLYAGLLRLAHTLFGTTRFIVNPYQLGAGNREALASGAFWFYYRLGFRPTERHRAALAAKQFARMRLRRGHRTPMHLLGELAAGDVELVLPGARPRFDEAWLAVVAEGAARRIAAQGGATRSAAVRRLADDVARRLGVADRSRWRPAERQAFERLAPVAALVPELEAWPAAERRALVTALRAKGAPAEAEFARALGQHDRFREALARYCREGGSGPEV